MGTQAVVNEISKKEKFWRKKYIAVFKWESTKTREIMVRFPVTLNIYVISRKKKNRISSCGSLVKPSMMNVVIAEWFLVTDFILLPNLHIKVTETASEEQCQIWQDQIVTTNNKLVTCCSFYNLKKSFIVFQEWCLQLHWIYYREARTSLPECKSYVYMSNLGQVIYQPVFLTS